MILGTNSDITYISLLLTSMLISNTLSNASGSTEFIKHYYHCVLVWKLNWIFLAVFFEYFCLNVVVNINSFGVLNITFNTGD